MPPATHRQVSNAGCNGIYARSSLQCHLDFGHDNDHLKALRQLFRPKTKAISPFDRKGKRRKLACSDDKVWEHNFFTMHMHNGHNCSVSGGLT